MPGACRQYTKSASELLLLSSGVAFLFCALIRRRLQSLPRCSRTLRDRSGARARVSQLALKRVGVQVAPCARCNAEWFADTPPPVASLESPEFPLRYADLLPSCWHRSP